MDQRKELRCSLANIVNEAGKQPLLITGHENDTPEQRSAWLKELKSLGQGDRLVIGGKDRGEIQVAIVYEDLVYFETETHAISDMNFLPEYNDIKNGRDPYEYDGPSAIDRIKDTPQWRLSLSESIDYKVQHYEENPPLVR